MTHGPLAAKDYSKKINKKVRIKALHLILSEKLRKHEVMFLDDISMKEPKTRDAKVILAALAGVKGFEKLLTKKRNAAYIAASGNKEVAAKSFSNFGNVNFDDVKNMNPLDLLSHKYVVFAGTAEGVKFVEDKLTK